MALAFADVRGRLAVWRIAAPRAGAAVWIAVLLTTYAAQLAILWSASDRTGWPLPLLPSGPAHADLVTASLLLLAAAQVYALAGLYRCGPSRGALVAGGSLMLALSVCAPFVANGDIYAYVGNGLLGRGAYTPPPVAFAGDLAAINARWGAPVPAATYGPLWLAVARMLVGAAPTLLGKLLAFRILGAALFAASIALLRAYGAPVRVLALAALNPGLQLQFVTDAHNDLLPVVLVIAAAVAVWRFPYAACALVVAAALVKLPYALAGLPVLAPIVPRMRRFAACAAVVLAAAALSWLGGGAPYARALISYAVGSQLESWLHVVAAAAALAALVAAVAGARRLRAAVWLVPMLGAYTASWYAIWSLPYALGSRRVLAYLLVWFPAVSIFAEPSLARPWTMLFVVPALVVTALL